jgi:hypothetical protein
MSASELRDFIEYDPDTELFRFRNPTGRMNMGWIPGTMQRARKAYRRIFRIMGNNYQAHRMAWAIHYGEWPTNVIDHIDGDSLNNRIANLRDVTIRGNAQNMKIHRNGSPVGASGPSDTGKWLAHIEVNEERYYLGCFDSEESASLAYWFCSESENVLSAIKTVRKICLRYKTKKLLTE